MSSWSPFSTIPNVADWLTSICKYHINCLVFKSLNAKAPIPLMSRLIDHHAQSAVNTGSSQSATANQNRHNLKSRIPVCPNLSQRSHKASSIPKLPSNLVGYFQPRVRVQTICRIGRSAAATSLTRAALRRPRGPSTDTKLAESFGSLRCSGHDDVDPRESASRYLQIAANAPATSGQSATSHSTQTCRRSPSLSQYSMTQRCVCPGEVRTRKYIVCASRP